MSLDEYFPGNFSGLAEPEIGIKGLIGEVSSLVHSRNCTSHLQEITGSKLCGKQLLWALVKNPWCGHFP